MRALFLDVGHGSCTILITDNYEAVLVDCGRRSKEVITALDRYRVKRIRLLCLTHSDIDHTGGAAGVLHEYCGRIDKILVPMDKRLNETSFCKKLSAQIKDGLVEENSVLAMVLEARPRVVLRGRHDRSCIQLLAPNAAHKVLSKTPNGMSGVIEIKVGRSRAVLCGDSTIHQWKTIASSWGSAEGVDIVAVSHHGGSMGADEGELAWLYSGVLRPRYAVVSVGTSNDHGHPREDVVHALRESGAHVLCTQITDKCCDSIHNVSRTAVKNTEPGRANAALVERPSRGRHVACAGTIVADLSKEGMVVHRRHQHRAFVDSLHEASAVKPLCRASREQAHVR
jgi:competence protein ComEC